MIKNQQTNESETNLKYQVPIENEQKQTTSLKASQNIKSYPSDFHDESSNQSNSSQPQPFGLKLIFRRQSGDKYEIKSSTGAPSSPGSVCSTDSQSRPRREAARKVKFQFSETESDDSPIKKRPKFNNNLLPNRSILHNSKPKPPRRFSFQQEFKEILIPFNQHDIVDKSDSLISDLFKKEAKVSLNHSVPFPIALVEDKTNIVYTKALLMIHLYQSYSSPCIICVLCKNFFSIGEFSKHFHITDEDLDEEDYENEDDIKELEKFDYLNILEFKKQKKLLNLRKKSYKILPYCLNKNNELNESQLKIWKLFSERFTTFKQKRAVLIQKQTEIEKLNNKKKIEKKLTKCSNLRPKSKKKENSEMKNWDYMEDDNREKYFYLNKAKLECDRIVYLNKNGSKLSDMDTSSESDSEDENKFIQNRPVLSHNKKEQEPEPDLSLSEDETESQVEKIETKKETVCAEDLNKFLYEKPPSSQEKRFNYYDNLSHEILLSLKSSSIVLVPQSLILYELRNKFRKNRNILLAQTEYYRLKWLCLTLDLEVDML